MQRPVFQLIRAGLAALLRKLIPEVLTSALATLLVMIIVSGMEKPALSSRDGGQNGTRPCVGLCPETQPVLVAAPRASSPGIPGPETNAALADFMERIALSHVAALKVPAGADEQETIAAAAAVHATTPPPPKVPAPRSHKEQDASKLHLAHSTAKPLPGAQQPLPVPEPSALSASSGEKPPLPLLPHEFGRHLMAGLGSIVSASDDRLAAFAASVGDTLSSIAKNL